MKVPTQKIIACPICGESVALPMKVRVSEPGGFTSAMEVRVEIDEQPLLDHIEADLREGEVGLISDSITVTMQIDDEGQPFISVDESEDMTLVTALGLLEMAKDTIIRNHMDPEEDS